MIKQDSQTVELARRVAEIVGPQSAAAQAVATYDQRIAEGEDVDIFKLKDSFLVGPPLDKREDTNDADK